MFEGLFDVVDAVRRQLSPVHLLTDQSLSGEIGQDLFDRRQFGQAQGIGELGDIDPLSDIGTGDLLDRPHRRVSNVRLDFIRLRAVQPRRPIKLSAPYR